MVSAYTTNADSNALLQLADRRNRKDFYITAEQVMMALRARMFTLRGDRNKHE